MSAAAAAADNIKGWRPLQGAKSKKQMARAKAIEERRETAIEEKEKLLKNQRLIRTPVVRNGKKATVGYAPETWSEWE